MKKVKLGELVEKTITGEWGNDLKENEIGTKVIRTADFNNDGTISYENVVRRSIDDRKVQEKQLKYGDIIIEKSGGTDKKPVGRVVFFDKKEGRYLANNFTQIIRIDKQYNSRYIFYNLMCKYKKGATLSMFNKTTGIQNLQMKQFLNQEIIIIDNEVQNKIVKVLDLMNEVFNIRKKQLEKLEELIKSQFVEMFENKKYEKLSGKELFSFSSGKFLEASKRLENGVPVYGGNGVAWYTDEPLIDFNTIVIGRVGAYCGNVKLIKEPVWITDNAIFIKQFKKDVYNIDFLYYMMELVDFSRFAQFSGQPKITQKPLEEFNYVVPPIEEQIKFSNIVRQIDKQKFEIEKSLKQMQELYESLMEKYFG